MGVRSNVKDAKILIAFSLLAHRQGYWVKWPLEPVWGIFCPNSKIKNLLFFPFFLIIEFGQIKQKIENVQCSPASTNMIVSYTLGQKKKFKIQNSYFAYLFMDKRIQKRLQFVAMGVYFT